MTVKTKSYDPGVYVITNIITGKFYIGSSVNILTRITAHKNYLSKGTHQNKHLQAAYDKYGKESFEYNIMELCSADEVLSLEQSYLDKYWDYDILYNINPEATGSRGRENSPEAIAKFKATAKLSPWKHSEETREKMSAWQRGRVLPQETRDKISAASKGRKMSEESIKKGVEARKKSGYNLSEEGRAVIVARNKAMAGRKMSEEQIKRMVEGRKKAGYKLSDKAREALIARNKAMPKKVYTEEEWATIQAKRRATRERNKAAKLKELENGNNP